MFKIIRDKSKFQSYINKIFVFSQAVERLLISIVAMLVFCHVSACIWLLIIGIGTEPKSWLLYYNFDSADGFDQYAASFYLIVQTVVTVGYGDLSPMVPEEQFLKSIVVIF